MLISGGITELSVQKLPFISCDCLLRFKVGTSGSKKKCDCRKKARELIYDLLRNEKFFEKKSLNIKNSKEKNILGKPILFVEEVQSEINISISHDMEVCFVAYSKDLIGIDVSYIRPLTKYKNLFDDSLNQNSCYFDSNDFYYTFLWTIKESLTKSIGIGLKYGINSVIVKKIDLYRNKIVLEISDNLIELKHYFPQFFYFFHENYIFMMCQLQLSRGNNKN